MRFKGETVVFPEICDQVILSSTLFLIVFAPLAYGGVDGWALNLIRIVVLVMLGAWLLKSAYHRNFKFFHPPFTLAAGLFVVHILFQLAPLPAAWREFLAPVPRDHSILLPSNPDFSPPAQPSLWTNLSLYPTASLDGFLSLLTYLGLCGVLLNNFRERTRLRFLVMTLIAIGSFEAAYGLIEYWSGRRHIFWITKVVYLDDVTGTYVNHNHFAGLMELILPLAVGLLVERKTSHAAESSNRSATRMKVTNGSGFLKRAPLIGAVALMLVGLILSNSRGGLLSSLLSLLLLACFVLRKRGQGQTSFQIGIWVALLFGMVSVGLGREIISRFSYSIRDAPERLGVWKDSLKMVSDFPLWGTGLGTFRYVFPNYRSKIDFLIVNGVPRQATWNFAHNDFLQLLVECGIFGLLLALWALFSTFWHLFSPLNRYLNESYTTLEYSCVAGLLAIVFHSFVDFNLHIPANALIFCVLLCLAINLAHLEMPATRGNRGDAERCFWSGAQHNNRKQDD